MASLIHIEDQGHLKGKGQGHIRKQDLQRKLTDLIQVMKISAHLTLIQDQKDNTKSQLHTKRKSLLLHQENKVGQGHIRKQDLQRKLTDHIPVMEISAHLTLIQVQKDNTKSQLHTKRKSLLLHHENKVGQGHIRKFILQEEIRLLPLTNTLFHLIDNVQGQGHIQTVREVEVIQGHTQGQVPIVPEATDIHNHSQDQVLLDIILIVPVQG